ncbi:hypothetical protein MA16_Dca000817 [Dendrobium catenatum]|uniref:Uncharacterized protein n=1 Tax=Dendrobium catenatum TaxID=906689 RepID=A0A2I0WUZ9_9ASPA|nr:hypothetical protein MA16_Dca000817 [Dendrobium catenatum]
MKTLACVLAAIFPSSMVNILNIHKRGLKLGTVTPMDQVLWRTHAIEASLTVISSRDEVEELQKE